MESVCIQRMRDVERLADLEKIKEDVPAFRVSLVSLDSELDLHQKSHAREHEILEASRLEIKDAMDERLEQMNHCVKKTEWQLAHESLEKRVLAAERLVYMGVGACSLIGVALHFWTK